MCPALKRGLGERDEMSRRADTNLTQPPTTDDQNSSGEDGEFCVWFRESSMRVCLTRCASGLERRHLRRAGETSRRWSTSSSTKSSAGSDKDWSTLDCDAVTAAPQQDVDGGHRPEASVWAKLSMDGKSRHIGGEERQQGTGVWCRGISERKNMSPQSHHCSLRLRAGNLITCKGAC